MMLVEPPVISQSYIDRMERELREKCRRLEIECAVGRGVSIGVSIVFCSLCVCESASANSFAAVWYLIGIVACLFAHRSFAGDEAKLRKIGADL